MDRRILLGALLSAGFATGAQAQSLKDILKGIAKTQTTPQTGNSAVTGGLTQTNAAQGLREALSLGAVAAVTRVGKSDGYWGDSLIRIPLPNTLAKVQKGLAQVGMSGALDEVHLKVNRAAEASAPVARDLFVDAIKSMTLNDAVGIVKGGTTSGTQYLQKATTPRLTTLFTPTIEDALEDTGAVRALGNAISRNGLGGYVQKEPKVYLGEYAVGKALDGLFYYVGREESAIRTDPAKRTSDILKAVFG
ncbi:MAG: DUF4197 domain-containing protein [Asticcacaulis sp.]